MVERVRPAGPLGGYGVYCAECQRHQSAHDDDRWDAQADHLVASVALFTLHARLDGRGERGVWGLGGEDGAGVAREDEGARVVGCQCGSR